MSYQSAQIFSDNRINAICDYILDNLKIQFPSPEDFFVKSEFVLSGLAAFNIQKNNIIPIRNITFQTSNKEIYDWCMKNLDVKVFNCKSIKFKERLLFYPQNFFFEIWFTENVSPDFSYDVVVQKINEIPNDSL